MGDIPAFFVLHGKHISQQGTSDVCHVSSRIGGVAQGEEIEHKGKNGNVDDFYRTQEEKMQLDIGTIKGCSHHDGHHRCRGTDHPAASHIYVIGNRIEGDYIK